MSDTELQEEVRKFLDDNIDQIDKIAALIPPYAMLVGSDELDEKVTAINIKGSALDSVFLKKFLSSDEPANRRILPFLIAVTMMDDLDWNAELQIWDTVLSQNS